MEVRDFQLVTPSSFIAVFQCYNVLVKQLDAPVWSKTEQGIFLENKISEFFKNCKSFPLKKIGNYFRKFGKFSKNRPWY